MIPQGVFKAWERGLSQIVKPQINSFSNSLFCIGPTYNYCINPDLKSDSDYIQTYSQLHGQFASIINKCDIRWGGRSTMESSMGCYEDLITVRERQNENKVEECDQFEWESIASHHISPFACNREILLDIFLTSLWLILNHKCLEDLF